MAINSTLANQIFFASQGVPATGKENTAGQAYSDAVSYAHAAIYNPFEVLGGNTQAFVVKIYETILGRTNPLVDDPTGVVYWKNLIDNGTLSKAAFIDEMTVAAIRNGGADELAAKNANKAYIEEIYASVLGRAAGDDQAGKDYWTNALNTGAISRSQIVDEISKAAVANGDEGFKTANAAFIDNLYLSLLNRAADQEGKDYWLNQLNSGTSKANLVVDLINGTAPGADKANLDAKTTALNAFSTNFTDYNVLPGTETYSNARSQAGKWVNDINSTTADPTAEITTYLNNGYKAQYQEDAPAPLGTTVYATWNGALRGEWADAKDVANAEVTFKVDTEEEKGLVRQAEELGVDINTNTQNVLFKNLNGATLSLKKVLLNSNPNSAATVVADGLSDLPGVEKIIDLDGNTNLVFNGTDKIATLQSIDMGNGRNTLEIADAARLADGKVAVTMGDGANDKIILGKGDFSKAFGDIVGVEDIVQNDKTAPAHLKLSQISEETGVVTGITPVGNIYGGVDFKARKINFDGDFKVTVDATADFTDPVTGNGTAREVDISDIRGTSTATQVLTLDTVTEKANTITKVIGNNLDTNLQEVLDLGKETFANLDQIKDIYAVNANKAIIQKASALTDGFNLRGELVVTPQAAADLVDTSANKKGVSLSKITSEALLGGTSLVTADISNVSGNINEVIGSTDANVIDNVALKGATYGANLEKISDISVVTTATDENPAAKAIVSNIKVLENGFNLRGNIDYDGSYIDAEGNPQSYLTNKETIDLSKMTGELLPNTTDKSKVTLDVSAANASLTKVLGSTDANLQEIVDLAGVEYGKLAELKDIDSVKTTGATVLNKAVLGNSFDIIDDGKAADPVKNTLNVKLEAADTAVNLSGITASTSGNDAKVNVQANEASNYLVESILGSAGNGISEEVNFEATAGAAGKSFAKLATIDQINNVVLSGQFNSLTSITNANTVNVSGITAGKLTTIDATGVVNLGASDFSALTTLNGAVQGNGATISYDSIAEAIAAGNLKLNGEKLAGETTYSNTINIKATTSTEAGAVTDLSKITKTGNSTDQDTYFPTIVIKEAANKVILSGANAKINERVELKVAGVEITGADSGDTVVVKDIITVTNTAFKEIKANEQAAAGENLFISKAVAGADYSTELAARDALENVKLDNLTEGQKVVFYINNTANGRAYIWEVTKGKGDAKGDTYKFAASIDELFKTGSTANANGEITATPGSSTPTPGGEVEPVIVTEAVDATGKLDLSKHTEINDTTKEFTIDLSKVENVANLTSIELPANAKALALDIAATDLNKVPAGAVEVKIPATADIGTLRAGVKTDGTMADAVKYNVTLDAGAKVTTIITNNVDNLIDISKTTGVTTVDAGLGTDTLITSENAAASITKMSGVENINIKGTSISAKAINTNNETVTSNVTLNNAKTVSGPVKLDINLATEDTGLDLSKLVKGNITSGDISIAVNGADSGDTITLSKGTATAALSETVVLGSATDVTVTGINAGGTSGDFVSSDNFKGYSAFTAYTTTVSANTAYYADVVTGKTAEQILNEVGSKAAASLKADEKILLAINTTSGDATTADIYSISKTGTPIKVVTVDNKIDGDDSIDTTTLTFNGSGVAPATSDLTYNAVATSLQNTDKLTGIQKLGIASGDKTAAETGATNISLTAAGADISFDTATFASVNNIARVGLVSDANTTNSLDISGLNTTSKGKITSISDTAGNTTINLNETLGALATIDLGAGDDELTLGANFSGAATVTVKAGEGNDKITVNSSKFASVSDLTVELGAGTNSLTLGASFDASSKNVTVNGGAGNDTFDISAVDTATKLGTLTLDLKDGKDTIKLAAIDYTTTLDSKLTSVEVIEGTTSGASTSKISLVTLGAADETTQTVGAKEIAGALVATTKNTATNIDTTALTGTGKLTLDLTGLTNATVTEVKGSTTVNEIVALKDADFSSVLTTLSNVDGIVGAGSSSKVAGSIFANNNTIKALGGELEITYANKLDLSNVTTKEGTGDANVKISTVTNALTLSSKDAKITETVVLANNFGATGKAANEIKGAGTFDKIDFSLLATGNFDNYTGTAVNVGANKAYYVKNGFTDKSIADIDSIQFDQLFTANGTNKGYAAVQLSDGIAIYEAQDATSNGTLKVLGVVSGVTTVYTVQANDTALTII